MIEFENRPYLEDFLDTGINPADSIINSFVDSIKDAIFTLLKVKCTPVIGKEENEQFNKAIENLAEFWVVLDRLDKENQYVNNYKE